MNRRNITRFAFAIVILSFFLSTFVSLWSLRVMARQNLEELSKTLAARVNDAIGGELSEPIIVSRTMASDHLLIDALRNEADYSGEAFEALMADYLSGVRDGLDVEAAFVVSDASKRYYSFGGLNKQLDLDNSEFDRWYTRFIGSEKDYAVSVDRDEVGEDKWTVFVDARIEDEDGRLLGVCGVGARMIRSQALFTAQELEHRVEISLIDETGLVHVDTDEASIETAHIDGLFLSQSNEYIFQRLGSGSYAVTKYIDDLDWYLVVRSDGSGVRGQLINVLLLNVVLCALVLVIMILAVRIIASRTRALAKASFNDQATGLLNRRAFEEEKARLADGAMDEDFVYIIADLNGLKAANDNLGHAAGDELIRGAADCLRECLGKYGKVYRIGGDEFAAMLRLTEAQTRQALDALDAATARWQGSMVKELAIAVGVASSREFPSENITELSRIADERMYAAKEEYYRRTGKERRH